jgi:NitT/TauT family transport system permease protein
MASTSITEPGVALADVDATSAEACARATKTACAGATAAAHRRARGHRRAAAAHLGMRWCAPTTSRTTSCPAPSLILSTLFDNWDTLSSALWFTVKLTLLALLAAIVGGVLLAIAFALFKWVEIGLFPIAVILQVTPIIAIAPLILIYVSSTTAALLLCAWIVAFFPILSNTVIGLKSADSNLRDLFQLYKASPWQTFRYLLAPSALPYFMAGLKIAGGLSLIGAVVAEFTAGTAGKETGLASRILESSFRTEIPMMFAALLLVSLLGIVIFIVFAALSRMVLGHWHESEMRRER